MLPLLEAKEQIIFCKTVQEICHFHSHPFSQHKMVCFEQEFDFCKKEEVTGSKIR